MATYKLVFSDLAQTTLAAGIAAASTSLQVVAGGGNEFPSLLPGQAFLVTIQRLSGSTVIAYETVMVTARSGDNLTGIVRNIAGTNQAWNAGDTVTLLIPAAALNSFVQPIQAQAQAYNYAQDVGSANAYKAILTPTVNARVTGIAPIVFFAKNANTGPSTLDDGFGPVTLRTADGDALKPLDVQVNSLQMAYWDGATHRLFGVHHPNFSQLLGQLSSSQLPLATVLQWESFLSIAFSQLTGQILQAQIANSLNLPGSPTVSTPTQGDSTSRIPNTAFVNPASSLGSYRKSADGSVIQQGLCNPNGGTITVTFPLAFPTAVDSIVFGQFSGGATQSWIPTSGTTTRTSFPVSNTGGQTYWIARGR